jgi:cytoskeletal protein RodZ
MSTVAQRLRQARQAQNLSVQQVAEITKIRTDYLRALEDGNYEVFSAPVYLRGFVRSYSNLLKLETPQIMADLDSELGQAKKFPEPPSLSSQHLNVLDWVMLQLSRLDWRKGALGLGVLVLLTAMFLGWSAWRHSRTDDPLKQLPPGVYRSTQAVSGETLPLPAPRR